MSFRNGPLRGGAVSSLIGVVDTTFHSKGNILILPPRSPADAFVRERVFPFIIVVDATFQCEAHIFSFLRA
jgi:hypothetical protein